MAAPNFQLTEKQIQGNRLLGSPSTHGMLFGGSRSGKTFLIIRAILTRALGAPKSRHAALRYRFNHIKTSVIADTLPKVCALCFDDLWDRSRLDKTDWYLELPNGSELWFGGLDDKERTEKILGQEYATIFLNECSQIPWASRNMAVTRLAQQVDGLRLRMWYDCNPPSQAHWTYKMFQLRQDPETRQALPRPENYASMLMNPADNLANLPPEYIEELEALPRRQRERFLLGMFGDASEGQLWTYELLDQQRITEEHDGTVPEMQRIIIAVDPSGARGEEDFRSDEIGIVVVGLGTNQKGYILEDLSGRYGATGPNNWGMIVREAFRRWEADRVIGERNYGGDMVRAVVQASSDDGGVIPYTEVTASRGKVVRAEPVAGLFENQKAYLIGRFDELEDELTGFTVSGYMGERSPNRADAAIWGLTHLFPSISRAHNAGPDGIGGNRSPNIVHSNRMRMMRRGRR